MTQKNEKRTSLNFTFWQLVTTLSLDPGITESDLVRKRRRQKEQINKGICAALVATPGSHHYTYPRLYKNNSNSRKQDGLLGGRAGAGQDD